MAPSRLCRSRDFQTHLDAQFRVEVGQWLIEQKDIRVTHDGAADGDPLALAAGEVLWSTVHQFVQAQGPCDVVDASVDRRTVAPHHLQPETDVLAHRHMRVKRVGLEDHGDPALGGVKPVDHPVIDGNRPFGAFLQPRDHPQQGGLATARRADENDEFSGLDRKVKLGNDLDGPIAFDDAVQLD